MARPTYGARVIVLRKTKLGETDLVLTMLASDGSQLRAVAKGARKPANTFAARLELYSVADVLLASGKSLDIVKEARIVESNERVRLDLEHATAAACMAELLDRVTQADLVEERLFACLQVALRELGGAGLAAVPALCAAELLKTFAFCGLRPSLASCAVCGAPVPLERDGLVAFATGEGGAVCASCRPRVQTTMREASTLRCAEGLVHETFARIAADPPAAGESMEVLQLCRAWAHAHVGCSLKSLDFLLATQSFEQGA